MTAYAGLRRVTRKQIVIQGFWQSTDMFSGKSLLASEHAMLRLPIQPPAWLAW
jgi:hypothetical protein